MSFIEGMRLGANMVTEGRRTRLAAAADQRTQELHDLDMQSARETRAIMDESLWDTAPAAAMKLAEGPPAPGNEVPFSPYEGPPVAPPRPQGIPVASDGSLAGAHRLAMRLAAAQRNPDAFIRASAAVDAVGRNQRYAQIGNRAEAGDPELLAAVNQQSPHVTIVQRKDGYGLVAVDNDGVGREFSLTKQDLRKLAIGNAMLVDGDLQGGLAMIDGVNKDLAALIAARNSTQIEATKVNNAALTSAANAEYQRGTLAQRQREHADRMDLDRMTGAQYMVDEDGNTHAVAMRHNPRTGTFEPVTGPLPPGLRPFPKGGADKPPKIGRDGDYELIPGTNQVGMWQEGELLSRDAPSPSARPAALKKAGIDENLSDQFARSGELRWIDRGPTAGSEVIFGGKAYKVNDKADIAALNKAMRQRGAHALHMDEIARSYRVARRNYETTGAFEQGLKEEQASGRFAAFVRSIYAQESNSGKNTKTSNAGAVGGMQILPSTFSGVADKNWNIDNPLHNARAGIRYAREAWQAAQGNPVLAGAYYYGGPGGMVKAQQGIAVSDPRNPQAPDTLQYGRQIAHRMRAMRGAPVAALPIGGQP